MATRIDHEKPEGVDEPPIVKKVRYDESAKVAEDVKKVKIDEGEASDVVKENGDISGEDAQEQADKETKGSATPTTASPTQSDADAGKTSEEEDKTVKPNVTGSAFGGFAAFSTSSGFSGFTSSSSTGFDSSASSGFVTTFASSKSTTTEEESAGEESSDKPKTSGFGGFASFHNASTFSSIASQTTSTDGFETTASSSTDLSDVDAAVEKKKPDVVVSELSEAELANGEEGETILVEKRAKLFKLVDKDYAEVGIGPFRVLQANDADPTDKAAVRFVMRRESYARGPGTKLLINAFLSSLLTCVKKTEKALLLAVLEPSADDAAKFEPTTYLLRFGAPEDLEAVHARLERHMK